MSIDLLNAFSHRQVKQLHKDYFLVPWKLVSGSFDIAPVDRDGSCLFSSLAIQRAMREGYRDFSGRRGGQTLRLETQRAMCVDGDLAPEYRDFVCDEEEGAPASDTREYAERLADRRFFGGEPELHALAHHVLRSPIVVFDEASPIPETFLVKVYNTPLWTHIQDAYCVVRRNLHFEPLIVKPREEQFRRQKSEGELSRAPDLEPPPCRCPRCHYPIPQQVRGPQPAPQSHPGWWRSIWFAR